jgi:hypothetical protein
LTSKTALQNVPNISILRIANQKELVTDLITKAKQIEYLINSLPEPEPEEEQVEFRLMMYRLWDSSP